MAIGKNVLQANGYEAFIPEKFPAPEILELDKELLQKAALAERLIGKLDGITHILPDVDFFLSMYIIKDATYSAQIEGTRATIMDALEMDAGVNVKDTDADDILFYIKALNYGILRLKDFPFSLRFIREIHKELMMGARSSHFSDPGEFRRSQNWIGGTSPSNAAFVPPPPEVMDAALNQLEQFINNSNVMPIVHAALLHAQFETIHPFLDGNGRTGRLLITLFLYQRALLEKPVLFLSSYFKKHQQLYYDRLNGYHHNRVTDWLHFFLDAVIATANESIDTSKKITLLREQDMRKLQALGKREAGSGVLLLQQLFKMPLVSTGTVMKAMEYTRGGATKLIERFVQLDILRQKDETSRYGKTYIYKDYISIFNE